MPDTPILCPFLYRLMVVHASTICSGPKTSATVASIKAPVAPRSKRQLEQCEPSARMVFQIHTEGLELPRYVLGTSEGTSLYQSAEARNYPTLMFLLVNTLHSPFCVLSWTIPWSV